VVQASYCACQKRTKSILLIAVLHAQITNLVEHPVPIDPPAEEPPPPPRPLMLTKKVWILWVEGSAILGEGASAPSVSGSSGKGRSSPLLQNRTCPVTTFLSSSSEPRRRCVEQHVLSNAFFCSSDLPLATASCKSGSSSWFFCRLACGIVRQPLICTLFSFNMASPKSFPILGAA
jgi:hypothetical protein